MKIAGLVKSSFVDYPGKISSVVFLGGCNFACHYCHNSHILGEGSNTIDFQDALAEIKSQLGFIDGVVISGGEPTLHPNLYDIIHAVRELDLLVKLDTNGTNYEILTDLVNRKLVDYVAMDIKAPMYKYLAVIARGKVTDKPVNENLFYQQETKNANPSAVGYRGVLHDTEAARDRRKFLSTQACLGQISADDLKNVERSIEFLKSQTNVDYMFRTTLSPMLDEKDMIEIACMVSGARCFQLQQYVPNEYSKSHPIVLLPYSKRDAERFAKFFEGKVDKVLLRGF